MEWFVMRMQGRIQEFLIRGGGGGVGVPNFDSEKTFGLF